MENKINVAELLKYCPNGMELDCVSYDNVSFDKISDDEKAAYPIFCYITDKHGNRSGISFTENGCESKRSGAKCVIFPKGKTTWEEFVPPREHKIDFKPFDKVLVRDNNAYIWHADFYSHYAHDTIFCYVCVGHSYKQCIPYNEETSNLVGTTNDCPNKYKIWKDE